MNSRNALLCAMLVSVAVGFSACAKRDIFRNSTPTEYTLSQEDLRLVQYFITSDVTLSRTERKKESGVTGGNMLKAEESVYNKQVVIDRSTEGAAIKVAPNRLTIAFSRDVFLDFEPQNFELMTPYSLKRFNGTAISKSGDTVKYQDKQYVISYSQLPLLNYEFTKSLNEKRDREHVKGMTVEDMFRMEGELTSTNQVQPKRQADAPPEPRIDIPLKDRRLVRMTLKSGQRIEAYLIAKSAHYYYISLDIEPKNSPSRIDKSTITSSDITE